MTSMPATEILDLHAVDVPLARTHSEPLLNTGLMKVIRIELPQGSEIPLHSSPEESTLQCLTGSLVVKLEEEELRLSANQMIWLAAHRPHVIRANVDSLLLVTMQNPDQSAETEKEAGMDAVDETSQESFPASDPPAFNATGNE